MRDQIRKLAVGGGPAKDDDPSATGIYEVSESEDEDDEVDGRCGLDWTPGYVHTDLNGNRVGVVSLCLGAAGA